MKVLTLTLTIIINKEMFNKTCVPAESFSLKLNIFRPQKTENETCDSFDMGRRKHSLRIEIFKRK